MIHLDCESPRFGVHDFDKELFEEERKIEGSIKISNPKYCEVNIHGEELMGEEKDHQYKTSIQPNFGSSIEVNSKRAYI